jgi:tRNA U34 5-carboxymethylaminomethyl modifying GTPase MnmE/TrmE
MKQLLLVTVFLSPLKQRFTQAKTHTLHLGHIVDDKTLDEVLVSIFKGPIRAKTRSKYPVMALPISSNK